jgi:2-polyprenyl-6-methoxyphenol hydroxylase-like FAD-dependent oxidoreductase
MSLPSSTTVLIVGAGPVGVSSALSLWTSGVRDIVIVDEAVRGGELASRAFVIHSGSLQVRSLKYSGLSPF